MSIIRTRPREVAAIKDSQLLPLIELVVAMWSMHNVAEEPPEGEESSEDDFTRIASIALPLLRVVAKQNVFSLPSSVYTKLRKVITVYQKGGDILEDSDAWSELVSTAFSNFCTPVLDGIDGMDHGLDAAELKFFKTVLKYTISGDWSLKAVVKSKSFIRSSMPHLAHIFDSKIEPEYEAPDEYEDLRQIMEALMNNLRAIHVDYIADPWTATREGVDFLKKWTPEDKDNNVMAGIDMAFILSEYGAHTPHDLYVTGFNYLKRIASDTIVDFLSGKDPSKLPIQFARLKGGLGNYVALPMSILPVGFTGMVGLEMTKTSYKLAFYSEFGEILTKPPTGVVVMNRHYTRGSTENVCKYMIPWSAGKSINHLYTREAHVAKRIERYEGASRVVDNIKALRAKWVKGLKSTDTKTQILAAMCEIGYTCAPRTGEVGNGTVIDGKKHSTYALTTLLVKHVIVQSKNLIFIKYLGKAAEIQNHEISGTDVVTKQIIRILTQLVEGKNPDDPLFTYPSLRGKYNGQAPVTNRMLNDFLKKLPMLDQTFKVFRKLKATVSFKEFIDKALADNGDKPWTDAQATKTVLAASVYAGTKLGHAATKGKTPSGRMALQYYILTQYVVGFFEKTGTKMPKDIKLALSIASDDED